MIWFTRLWGRKREPSVPSFWSSISQGKSDEVGGLRYGGSVDCVNDLVRGFFRLMVMNKSHAVVFGPIGAGKSSLMKNALQCLPEDYAALVPDVVGGVEGYEGYTDYYAPYPINVVAELSPVILPSVLAETFEIAGEVNAITPTMARNLEVLAAWLLGLQPPPQGLDVSKYPRNLGGLIKLAEDAVNVGVIQGNLIESIYALIRRLSMVRHWMVDYETHPIIRRLLSGELRGKSVGIDLSVFEDDVQQWFYMIALMRALGRRGVRNVLIVLDEAHLFLHKRSSTLYRLLRIGRNRRFYFALISQSPSDFPDSVFNADRLFVEFPIPYLSFRDLIARRPSYKYAIGDTEPGIRPRGELEEHWRDVYVAILHIHSMTREAKEHFGPGLSTIPIKVNVEVQPKPNAVTLRRCVESVAPSMVDDLMNVIREYGFSHVGYNKLLEGVWRCIGA
ncbi:hypothetical protein B7L68_05635 [Thermoproteus sp. CP80]|uniref:ATP-binding protein n=1 Tax=Thermoproteus sp. CP80 TaxID=1650659 RepID=UPI0009BF7D01|nr:ATP-binding protein [Thermoproteus sp. CP80]PLC64010.1 hypothetical protein B7L68_05635 [Thermoproteus sp. CP80]